MRRTILFSLILLVAGHVPGLAKRTPEWVRELDRRITPVVTEDDAAVLLLMDIEVETEYSRMNVRYRKAYKILKMTGASRAFLTLHTNKRSPVEEINGWKLDNTGKVIDRFDEDDVGRTAISMSFMDDAAQLFAGFEDAQPGETVCFEYTISHFMYFRDLSFPLGGKDPVKMIRVTLGEGAFGTVLNNIGNQVQQHGNIFELRDRPALESEGDSIPMADRLPHMAIHCEPDLHSSWAAIGAHFWKHTAAARSWPDALDTGLDLKSTATKEEIIRRVTRHVREDINYVDIELGTGSIVPSLPAFVHEKAYGDCKDKTFYAMALFEVYGLKAYPFLCAPLRYGEVYPEFPAFSQFNHCILAIPLTETDSGLKNVSIDGKPWLFTDLTDIKTPIPLVTYSLENALGILVQESDTKLVRIPRSRADENVSRYELDMYYGPDGTMTVKLVEKLKGHPAASESRFRDSLAGKDPWEKYRSWIHGHVPGSRLESFETHESDDGWQITTVNFVVENYGVSVGDETLLVADIMSQGLENGFRSRRRTTPVRLDYLDTDQTIIRLTVDPVYAITAIPDDVDATNEDYILQQTVRTEENTVHMETIITLRRAEIPAESYGTFRKNHRKMLKLAKAPIRVRKSTQG